MLTINQKKTESHERKRINKVNNRSIEIIDNNTRISPIKLIEPGKLLDANKKNKNIKRKIDDIKNNESMTRLLVLLMNKPINKKSAMDDKL